MFTELMASGSGGGGSNQNPLLYANHGQSYPTANAYKRDDFDDIASVSGEGTNTLTFTFKKSVKGTADGFGLNNTITGTATIDANPLIEYGNNPPKHNGQYIWPFEAEAGQTLVFACIAAVSQRISIYVN